MYFWAKINGEWEICEIGSSGYLDHFVNDLVKECGICDIVSRAHVIEENDLGTIWGYSFKMPLGEVVERYFVVPHNPEKTMIFVHGRLKTKSGGIITGEVFLHTSNDIAAGKRWIRKNRECLPLDSDVSPDAFVIVPPTFRSSGLKRGVHAEKGTRWEHTFL